MVFWYGGRFCMDNILISEVFNFKIMVYIHYSNTNYKTTLAKNEFIHMNRHDSKKANSYYAPIA